MILITIDEHPLQSDAFDKFLAGMAIGSYDGPTTMERLQALHDHMDALNAHYAELRQAGRLKETTNQP